MFLYDVVFVPSMLIGKKVVDEGKIHDLLRLIKRKKELSTIRDEFVHDRIFEYFQRNVSKTAVLGNPKSKKYKQIVKDIRAELRRAYGLFRVEEDSKKRAELVEYLISLSAVSRKAVTEVLKTHSSTRERLEIYEKLYQKLWKITGTPKKILDLGSGINPFSIPLMKLRSLEYYAYDISENETNSLNQFFDFLSEKNSYFSGHAGELDLLHFAKIEKLRNVDVCFLFKMTDVLDKGKGHKMSEEVMTRIPAKHIVLSFATKTMSGKKMTAPRRRWVEWMCTRLEWKYKVLEFPNEIFYVIAK